MSTTMKKDQNQARDAANQAMDKTKEAASHVGDALQHGAAAVGQAADDATASVGSNIQKVAGQVRDQGPQEGILGSATQGVASALENTGKYFEDKQLSGMMDDVTGLIKRNPVPAVLLGLGIGFLVGRALSSRS